MRSSLLLLNKWAGGPAFRLQKPPELRVPRPSRTLRRAGTTTAYTTGSVGGQKLRRQYRRPPLQKTQGWGTLGGNGAMQRWAARQMNSHERG